MKKQILTALLIGCTAFGFTGCGNQDTNQQQLVKLTNGQYMMNNSVLGEKYILLHEKEDYKAFKVVLTNKNYNSLQDLKTATMLTTVGVADCVEYDGKLYYYNEFSRYVHIGERIIINKNYDHNDNTVNGEFDEVALVVCTNVERYEDGKFKHAEYKVVKDFTKGAKELKEVTK